MIRIGTCNYQTLSCLKADYPHDWSEALQEGRVSIGRPVVSADAKLYVDSTGRYVIYYEETGSTLRPTDGVYPGDREVTGEEGGELERVHMTVEDITAACLTWSYRSTFDYSAGQHRMDEEDAQHSAADAIQSFIDELEAQEVIESKNNPRWWVFDDWRTMHTGVALMCQAKDKGLMMRALERIAEYVDGFPCLKLAQGTSTGGVFLS